MILKCSVVPASPNRTHGHHWAILYREKKRIKDALALENAPTLLWYRSSGRLPLRGPLRVTFEHRYCGQPRDLDNLGFALAKATLDAMKVKGGIGVIEDDNPNIVSELVTRQTKVSHERDQGFTVELEELGRRS